VVREAVEAGSGGATEGVPEETGWTEGGLYNAAGEHKTKMDHHRLHEVRSDWTEMVQ
jgi:hypothetical protein